MNHQNQLSVESQSDHIYNCSAKIYVGTRHAGSTWVCLIGGHEDVVVEADGSVELAVCEDVLSVYVPQAARELLEQDWHRLTTIR